VGPQRVTVSRVCGGGLRGAFWLLAIGAFLGLSACAPRRVALPQDAGAPMADAAAVHAEASATCRGLRTFTAELGLSGQVGENRVRGRVIAGFERPGSMRLEGVAPFGPSAFILAARPGAAVLLLPRDERVVRDTEASTVLGALTGVPLSPADLLAALTGCVVPEPVVAAGRLHDKGWASLDLGNGATMYLRRVGGRWQPRAARRPAWDIEYDLWEGGLPRAVRLRSTGASTPVTLSVGVSQVETNVDIMESAFTLAVLPGTGVLTVEELRRVGPLRDR
jgi:outer membrane biogenesis lipoprotein LolB